MGFRFDYVTEANALVDGDQGSVELDVFRLGSGQRFLNARPQGYLRHEELVKLTSLLVEDPRFGAQLPTLWDFRGYDFSVYTASEFRTHAFILPRFPTRIGVKKAYLVDTDTGFGTMRMFQGAASGFNLEQQDNLMVSYSLEEIVDWLID
jgi:hypothetical protein